MVDRPRHFSRHGIVLAAAVAVLSTGVALWAKSWCGLPGSLEDQYLRWCYSDVPALFFAERLHEGAIPYLDHAVEYPVLTGLWMWIGALPVNSLAGFFWVTGTLLAAAAGLSAWLLAVEVGWSRTMVFAAAPVLMVSGAVNWDLPAVALATGGIVAHRRARDGLAGGLLGLGVAAKLYPGLALLAIVPAAWRLRGRPAALRTAGAAAGAWLAVNVPIALAAPDAWLRFFRLSRERPADWDSLYTLVRHVTGDALATDTVNHISAIGLAAVVVAIGVVAWRRDAPERWHLASLPLLAGFLLTSKVYSPQFSVWLLPLLAFAFPGWGWWAAFVVADLTVTLTRFPYLAGFVGDGLPGAAPYGPFGGAVLLRAVVLTTVAWIGWRRSSTQPA